jgi:DNA-binding transcriptional LysR family regulator
MDRLDAMAVFVTALDEGSLAAAGRKLGRSPATISRAISLLEERIGQRLLHRTARRLRLTTIGERHLLVYRTVLAELAEADNCGHPDEIDGRLSIASSEIFGRQTVVPLIEEFLVAHSRIRVRALLSNDCVNLVDEGIDVAIRAAPLSDSGVIAVRLGEIRRIVCAAPSYLDRHGLPERPMDLANRICIGEEGANERALWRFLDRSSSQNRNISVSINPRIALNGAGAAIDAAVRGSGICRAFSHQVVEHVSARRLVRVLPSFEPDPIPVHLVFHPIPRRNAALRAFVDYATPRLRSALQSVSAKMTIGDQP